MPSCSDEDTTAHKRICIGVHCPCTNNDDCMTTSKKCYQGVCYHFSEFCGDIICSEKQVCIDEKCVAQSE